MIKKKFIENKNENEKLFDAKTQQFRRNEIREICDDENHYENSFEILMIKLKKLQKHDSMMQKIRTQFESKNQRKTCEKKN